MQIRQAANLASLSVKAGRLVYGNGLIPSIQHGRCRLVLYSEALGDNKKKKIRDKTAFYKVPAIELSPEVFGQICPNASLAFGITDASFSSSLLKALSDTPQDALQMEKPKD